MQWTVNEPAAFLVFFNGEFLGAIKAKVIEVAAKEITAVPDLPDDVKAEANMFVKMMGGSMEAVRFWFDPDTGEQNKRTPGLLTFKVVKLDAKNI